MPGTQLIRSLNDAITYSFTQEIHILRVTCHIFVCDYSYHSDGDMPMLQVCFPSSLTFILNSFTLIRAHRSSCGLKFGMFWSMFMFFIIIILNIPFHFLTSFFGDFCMAPTLNTGTRSFIYPFINHRLTSSLIVSFTYNVSDALHQTVSYYLACQGESELAPHLNTSETGIHYVIH